jgi:serine/threonine protein kinase
LIDSFILFLVNDYETTEEIENKTEKMKQEIKLLATLENEYIINYKTAWVQNEMIDINKSINDSYSDYSNYDNNEESDIRLLPILYIQMELCSFTLSYAINEMNSTLNQNKEIGISLIGKYISYELFKQILLGVNYLHTRNPPIIHRDLKPSNILITNNGKNGTFVKITDFGLATIHGLEICDDKIQIAHLSHTTKVGTPIYRAPEVNMTGKYNTQSDMYSIAVIMRELFCIEDKEFDLVLDYELHTLPIYSETPNYFEQIHNILIKYRFSCEQMLVTISDNNMISYNDIKYENKIKQLCYEYGELKYRPKITQFTNYFLWNKIQRDIIRNNSFQQDVNRGIERINEYKIEYKFNLNKSQEIMAFIYHEIYVNIFNASEYKYADVDIYNDFLKKLSDKTNMTWVLCKVHDNIFNSYINWFNCDYLLIKHISFLAPQYLFFNILEDCLTNCKPAICYCDEKYQENKENVLLIVNEVINNIQLNMELQEIEINRQLKNMFGKEVFCYLNKYMYISQSHEWIKIAIRFGQYNILISDQDTVKLPLNENLFKNIIQESDRNVIQSGFEHHIYLLPMNCVKLIKFGGIKSLIIQQLVDKSYEHDENTFSYNNFYINFSIISITDDQYQLNRLFKPFRKL